MGFEGRRLARLLGVGALALGGFGRAGAQPVAPEAAPAGRGKTVEGVTVRAAKRVAGIDVNGNWCPTRPRGDRAGPPRVVATSPREGEAVPPGPVTLRLTFDQPMNCGWAMAYDSPEEACTQIGEWSLPDRRSWTMRCTLPADQTWAVRFEAVKGHGFASLAGESAAPFTLHFTTGPSLAPEAPPPGPEPQRLSRLLCPEHRLRGSGPRCRVLTSNP